MSPHGIPAVEVGQIWVRNADGARFKVDQQYMDPSANKDPDDWRLRNVDSNKLGDWIFGFSIRQRYTLEGAS